MPGKHAATSPARGPAKALAALVVLAAVVGGGYAAREAIAGPIKPSAPAATGGCTTRTALTVAVAPEVADQVRGAARRATAAQPCSGYDVQAVTNSAGAGRLGAANAPDIWVPDSTTWLDTVPLAVAANWKASGSVTRSPVVLATPTSQARSIGAPKTWASVVNGSLPITMAGPDKDAASRLAYFGSRIGQNQSLDLAVGGRLIFLSRFTEPSASTILAKASANPEAARAFPVSEQQLASHLAKHPGVGLREVVPSQGTLSLDYPWMSSLSLSGAKAAAASALLTEVGSTTTQGELTSAGFRNAEGSKGPTIIGAKAPAVTELRDLSVKQRVEAIQQWQVLRTDARMLAVIDVSGSMKQPSGTGNLTRYQVLQGACVEALKILPSGSKVGSWQFSTAQGGPKQDWRVMAPINRLDQEIGGTTQRARLTRLVKESTKDLRGDTGLYDSTLAAYRNVLTTWEPNYVNSVVVMTDGINDDSTGGIDLNTLLATLKAEANPNKPVRIITIGMGEADPRALKQISAATGGTSYIANTPKDIQRVFVEALLARPLPAA